MTMAQMMEIMRALHANVEASRVEQAKMHEDLVISQARNEELSKVTEELRQALHEQRGHATVEEVAPSSPPRVFPMTFAQAITDTAIPVSVVPVKASFTGVENPEVHLTAFHTQMMLSGGSDAVYCKMFMSTVPSRIRALTKSRSKSTPGVKVHKRRCLGEETPSASVAKARRRLGEGVAQPGRRQIKHY